MNKQLEKLQALVWEHESLWADIAQHFPRSQKMKSWFKDFWNPWYARFMDLQAKKFKPIEGVEKDFVAEAAQGLSGLRQKAEEMGIPIPDLGTIRRGFVRSAGEAPPKKKSWAAVGIVAGLTVAVFAFSPGGQHFLKHGKLPD